MMIPGFTELYEIYIGGIDPIQFIEPFISDYQDPIDASIKELIENWPFSDPVPEDFYTLIRAHIISYIKANEYTDFYDLID